MARYFHPEDVIVPRDKLKDWISWALVVHQVDGDGTLHVFPLGGGPEYLFDPVKVETFDFIKVPPERLENPGWYSADFYAEWLDKKYRGWTNGRRWNGWAMPYFELEEAQRYAKDSGNTTYDEARDAFVTIQEGHDEPEVDEPTMIKIRGRRDPVKVYPIGAGAWIWSEAGEEEGEEEEELEGKRGRRRRSR
jgi:hypothetical protein